MLLVSEDVDVDVDVDVDGYRCRSLLRKRYETKTYEVEGGRIKW